MKLDSIIYDKDTLAAAIAEQWNLESATFSAMYPSETSTALVNGMAAYGSMLQYMLVAQLANCYLDTAFSDNAVYQLADTLGNDLHGNGPAHVLCNMSKNNLVNFDIVVPANTQFRLDNKTFYNDSAIILPSNVTKVTDINLTQGEVITETKTTSGLENEKLYFGSNFEVYSESVKVWVNDERWQVSDSFLPYNQYEVLDTSDMNTVVFKTCADGRCYIKLGNGDFANLPTAGSIVKIQYVKNLGTGGNIEEINIDGTIVTPLTFLDNHNKEVNLDLTITSTTPAYGGFSKQSVDLLRQTSPAVFASGHRAVRRSDYNAIFRNKLGYITSQTWGEYEEAKDQGIDDAIMMNVVYYTGLKSYQHTPYYEIGAITNTESYEGSVGTTRGFHGSYNIKMFNASDTENNMVYKDNSGKGILFIDNLAEALDTDDLISTWNCPEGTTTHPYLHIEDRYGTLTNDPSEAHANPVENIISTKDGYFLSRHEPSLENPTQIILDFTGIKYPQGDESVTRQGISIAGFSFMPMAGYSFIDQFAVYGTNTLTIPDTTNVRNSTQWTKLVDKQEPVKNGNNYTEWVATNCFLNKTSYDDAPASKKAAYDDPNACKDDLSIPYWKYNYYIIEIYSSDRTGTTAGTDKGLIAIRSMKVKYNFNYTDLDNSGDNSIVDVSSRINYDNNGSITLKFPEGIINSENYRLWAYTPKLENITGENRYRSSDVLSYVYTIDNEAIPFRVTIRDVDNNIYLTEVGNTNGTAMFETLVDDPEHPGQKISKTIELSNINVLLLKAEDETTSRYNNVLTGTSRIELVNPANLVAEYKVYFDSQSGPDKDGKTNNPNDFEDNVSSYFAKNQVFKLRDTDGITNLPITLRISTEPFDNTIQEVKLLNRDSFVGHLEGTYDCDFMFAPPGTSGSTPEEAALIPSFKIKIKSKPLFTATVAPENGTIKIESTSNMEVDASFTGNRISKEVIDSIDQVTINEYNHFTTSVEFKQPKVTQVDVKVMATLEPDASRSSALIIQDIKNNITDLFTITPDYMGKGLRISDIYLATMKVAGVSYCKVALPSDNVIVPPNTFMILGDLEVIESAELYR